MLVPLNVEGGLVPLEVHVPGGGSYDRLATPLEQVDQARVRDQPVLGAVPRVREGDHLLHLSILHHGVTQHLWTGVSKISKNSQSKIQKHKYQGETKEKLGGRYLKFEFIFFILAKKCRLQGASFEQLRRLILL